MRSATSSTSEPSDVQHQRTASLGARDLWLLVGAAWLGSFIVLLALLVAILVLHRQQITSVWELQMGLGALLPSSLLVTMPFAVVGAVVTFALLQDQRLWARRLVPALASFAFGAWVGFGVGGGRHLAELPIRVGFAALVATVGFGLSYALAPALARGLKHAQTRPGYAALLFGVIIFGLEFINTTVLVRLYPAFHHGLSALELSLGASYAALILSAKIPEKIHLKYFLSQRNFKIILPALVLLAGLTLGGSSRALAGYDNFRFLISEGSPTASLSLELASAVTPPSAIDPELASLPLGAKQAKTSSGIDFSGRSIVLISIDALRADHLTCYGYERPTSPNIDKLATRGVRFDAAHAPTPHTSYSVTSLMTGKYMRPLLLQGAGEDSELWASLLQTYGYRTAAFYPPAIFFIDSARFATFKERSLGFEYAKIEFAEGEKRIGQVRDYLDSAAKEKPLFLWLHLFGPHEPYVVDPRFNFGSSDIDRYDSEIRAADETVGKIVELVHERDPEAVVILTADHGEEFGDHGGRYHGTTVYDEQVRVPLIIVAPGAQAGHVISQPVQTIDLLPTVLDALNIVVPPRVRGRSLTPLLAGQAPLDQGLAVAETDDYSLLAEGSERLICQRRSGACRLFDLKDDPKETRDLSAHRPERAQELKAKARRIAETHGQYEAQGRRDGGQAWPQAIVLGISGDAQVAGDLAQLLDDAEVEVRRKAAELLLGLASTAQAPALRLALSREEDATARAWIALTLTQLGQGAPLVVELLKSKDEQLRRQAALVLAKQGNDIGERELITWFAKKEERDQQVALEILDALAKIRSKKSVHTLISQLDDVRLRPYIATTLARIGDKDARWALALALNNERFVSSRRPLAQAVLDLGGKEELVVPLARFLAVPDPLPQGLDLALQANILKHLGGPKDTDLRRLRQLSSSGVQLSLVVPQLSKKDAADEDLGVRVLVRARSRTNSPGAIYLQPGAAYSGKKGSFRKQPQIEQERALVLQFEPNPGATAHAETYQELHAVLPASFGAKPGHALPLEIYTAGDLEIQALAVLPLRSELPPPPPTPWKVGASADTEGSSASEAPKPAADRP